MDLLKTDLGQKSTVINKLQQYIYMESIQRLRKLSKGDANNPINHFLYTQYQKYPTKIIMEQMN